MGFIRGALFALAVTVFFFGALSSAVFFTIGSSLDYAAVQNQTANVVQQIVEQMGIIQEINNNLQSMKKSCNNLSSAYDFAFQEFNFSIQCEDLNKSVSLMISGAVNKFVSDSYYGTYDCDYWDCFDKYPLTFLLSEKSQKYWYKLFYFALTAVLVSAVALFFLMQKKRHLPFLTGGLIVLSSLGILGISKITAAFSNDIVKGIISIFFSKAISVFIRVLILGVIIIFIGLAIEFYRAGFKIYRLFSKAETPKTISKDKMPKAESSGKK